METAFSRLILERRCRLTRNTMALSDRQALMLSGEGYVMPKRIGHLYEKMKDQAFIRATVIKACYGRHKRKDVAAVLNDIDNVVSNLSEMLSMDTYVPSPYSELRIYDESSQKYRRIKTLPFYPDCLMQWLLVEAMKEPVFLRGMDYWSVLLFLDEEVDVYTKVLCAILNIIINQLAIACRWMYATIMIRLI